MPLPIDIGIKELEMIFYSMTNFNLGVEIKPDSPEASLLKTCQVCVGEAFYSEIIPNRFCSEASGLLGYKSDYLLYGTAFTTGFSPFFKSDSSNSIVTSLLSPFSKVK
jgi:hypothetical protein